MISPTLEYKIKSLRSLRTILDLERRKKRKIVAISGSMDLLHAGHVCALLQARKQGDLLVVCINSDVSVKMYKGPHRPIMTERERAYMVAGLSCVDYVCLFDEINPIKILRSLQPDVYCNSSEWGKDCVERNVIESYGGVVYVIPRKDGPSTTDIISRIVRMQDEKELCAVFLDRDGTINYDKNGYIHQKEDFEFLPGVIQALKKLSRTKYQLFIVTNQSGIGRKYYSEHDVLILHAWVKKELEKHNIIITEIYYCPHHPDDGCACRKPGYELLLRAVKRYGINLSKSWIVGDQWSDIAMGREANLKTIKIGPRTREEKEVAHYYVKDLNSAVAIIAK